MSEQRNNTLLVEEHYAVFWSGDDARMRQQISDEFVDYGAPNTPRGVEPVIAFSRVMRGSFPDMQIEINRSVAEGDLVAVHATWRGTHKGPFQGLPATNKSVAMDGMVFWRIAHGKFIARWAVLDIGGLMRQLQGVV
jgi:steroid delta-isomerase-like uncharacterized protein